MAEDRRRDVATALTGAGLLAAGGAMRHGGVRLAFPKKEPKIHAIGMLKAKKGKKLFWGGTGVGALGLPPLAVGTTRAVQRHDVDKAFKPRTPEERADRLMAGARRAHAFGIEQAKQGNLVGVRRANRMRNAKAGRAALWQAGMIRKADDKRGFWREGLSGTKDALHQRADSIHQSVPAKLRGLQLAAGASAGALGALGARAALGRRGDALKPILTPIAGGLAATGSVPLTNRAIKRRYPDYEVTPAGVRRRKTDRKLPSTKASQFAPQQRSLSQDVRKSLIGGVWKPAAQLTRAEISGLKTGARSASRVKHGPLYARGASAGKLNREGAKQFAGQNRRQRSLRQSLAKAYLGEGAWSPTKAMLGGLRGTKNSRVRVINNRMATDKYFGHLRAYNKNAGTAHPVGFRQSDPKQVFQTRFGKAADQSYLGSRTPYATQRAVITASGHPPIIGPFTAAAAARRYAPPGQERKQAVRQFALGAGAGVPAGVATAYAGAHLANRSDKAHAVAGKIVNTKDAVERKARRAVGLKPERSTTGRVARLGEKFLATGAGKPFRTPRGRVGGVAGLLAGRAVVGGVGGQAAISLNQRDQRRYNREHKIEKFDLGGRGQSKREKHTLAERKRRSAVLSTAGGTLGLTSLGLLAAGKRNQAITAGTVGSGLGGVNALLGARVQRQEAKNIDPVKKGFKDKPRLFAVRTGPTKKFMTQHPDYDRRWDKQAKHGKPTWRLWGEDIYRAQSREVDKADYSTFWAGHRLARKVPIARPRIVHLRRDNGRYACGAKHVTSMSTGIMTSPQGQPFLAMKRNPSPTSSSKYLHNVTCESCKAGTSADQIARSRDVEQSKLKSVHQGNSEAAREKRTGQHRSLQAIQRQINKSAPLAITGNRKEHDTYLRRYGDRGPLPKQLDRGERMKAYEARYVHHGGDKQNKWSRRATWGDRAKNAGLGVATVGTAAWLASRGKPEAKMVAKHPKLRHHAETVTGAGAVAGGIGEIYGGYARHKQSSYANSPGGVAASALRRMRENTPEGQSS